jgi:N-acetylglucosamine kinase-like BadF-type ATPase
MVKPTDLIVGVDGGGTKTTALLAEISSDGTEQILGRGYAGSSNIKAVGADNALRNLHTAIQEAWQASGKNPCTADLAIFGLSGAGRPETQILVNDWCTSQQIATRSQVVHDALPVLIAGAPAGQGIALIAGTGAVAYAVNAAGQTAIVGGWGFWFGDEGSAFSLGQAAARAISQASDGRGQRTLLRDLVLKRLKISEPREILTALGRDGADVRFALAELAPFVSQAAENGDGVALEIVASAACDLASLVTAAAEKVKLGHDFPLALAGGVICRSVPMRTVFLAELTDRGFSPTTVELVEEPAVGCVLLAARELANLQ